jgi:L-rhamnose mutarotase
VSSLRCQGRIARTALLRPGVEADYDRLHAAVWPEVLGAITRAGIRNYSIFRHGRQLFSYFELPEGSGLPEAIRVLLADPACARWEELIRPLQEPCANGADGTKWTSMDEVFHHA